MLSYEPGTPAQEGFTTSRVLGGPVEGAWLLVSQEPLQTAAAYVDGEMQDADSVQGGFNCKKRPRPQNVQKTYVYEM